MDSESSQDREWIDRLNNRSRDYRGIIFRPLLKLGTKIGISGNFISNIRLPLIVLFLFLWFKTDFYQWAISLLLIILLLDLFDGPLARFQKCDSDRGKFIDIFVDHIVYSCLLFALFKFAVPSQLIVYNLFIIPIAYLLSTIKKEEFMKSDWIIKPYPRLAYLKAIVVIPFFLKAFGIINLLSASLIIANLLATALSIYYFIFIQLRWRRIYSQTHN
jgi:phosphatidylglycerophosphate synthase